jgi:hypothetical protein
MPISLASLASKANTKSNKQTKGQRTIQVVYGYVPVHVPLGYRALWKLSSVCETWQMFISLFDGPQYNKRGMFSVVHGRMLTAVVQFYGRYLQGISSQLRYVWRVAAVTCEVRYNLTPFLGSSMRHHPLRDKNLVLSSYFEMVLLGEKKKR